jgi:hypothetical protein
MVTTVLAVLVIVLGLICWLGQTVPPINLSALILLDFFPLAV